MSDQSEEIGKLTAERDAANVERLKSAARVMELRLERDAAIAEAGVLRGALEGYVHAIHQTTTAMGQRAYSVVISEDRYDRGCAALSGSAGREAAERMAKLEGLLEKAPELMRTMLLARGESPETAQLGFDIARAALRPATEPKDG